MARTDELQAERRERQRLLRVAQLEDQVATAAGRIETYRERIAQEEKRLDALETELASLQPKTAEEPAP